MAGRGQGVFSRGIQKYDVTKPIILKKGVYKVNVHAKMYKCEHLL